MIGDDDYSSCPRYTRTYLPPDGDEPERRSRGHIVRGEQQKARKKITYKGEKRQTGGGGKDESAEQKKKKHKPPPKKICLAMSCNMITVWWRRREEEGEESEVVGGGVTLVANQATRGNVKVRTKDMKGGISAQESASSLFLFFIFLFFFLQTMRG